MCFRLFFGRNWRHQNVWKNDDSISSDKRSKSVGYLSAFIKSTASLNTINFVSLFCTSWVNLIRWTMYFLAKQKQTTIFRTFLFFIFFISYFWSDLIGDWTRSRDSFGPMSCQLEFEEPIRFMRNFASVNVNKVFSVMARAHFSIPECIK